MTGTESLNAYRAQLRQAPQQTARIVGATVNRVADKALKRYREAGKPITYPVRWQSERQRRAFFASNGFGHGIPYRRRTTNSLTSAWKLSVVYSGDTFPQVVLTNNTPYRKFVVGGRQQRMHKGRWYRQADLTRQTRIELAGEIKSALQRNLFAIDAAREAGGGR